MKSIYLSLGLAVTTAGLALADDHGEAGPGQQLDELLAGIAQPDEAKRYEPRQGVQDLTSDASAPGNEGRQAYVTLLLERLEAAEASPAAQAWILRQLENIGRAESVPPLTRMMGSPFHHLRELARRALEQNPSDEAGAALLSLVESEHDDNLKRALVHSLGQRGDVDAVGSIGSLLRSKDKALRRTAIIALGKIASDEATALLRELYLSGADERHLADALLECARRLSPNDEEKAKPILEMLYGRDRHGEIQAAALRGLLAASPEEADDLILLALQAPETLVRQAAINACRDLSRGPTVLPNVLAVKLPDMTAEEQAMVLAVLGDSGDTTVVAQLGEALEGDALSSDLHLAVVEVLGRLGGVDAAARMLDLAVRSSNDDLRQAARAALSRMPGRAVDASLIGATRRGDVQRRLEAIGSLASRGYGAAVPVLFAHVELGPRMIRQGSLRALGRLASAGDIPRLVGYVTSEDAHAMDAVIQACRRATASEEVVDAIVAAMEPLPTEGKERLLPSLGILGGEVALAKTLEYLGDEQLARTAMKTLTRWSGPEVVPALLELAGAEETSASDQTLMLRGLGRLLENPSGGIDGAGLLKYALGGLQTAKRPEDKRIFLPILGKLGTLEAANALVGMLEEEDIAEEAALAVLSAARKMRRRQDRATQSVLKAVIRADVDRETLERARGMLDKL